MFSKILALALVASVTAQACDTQCCLGDYAPTGECDAGWTNYNGKCYKMSGSSDQWGAARTACEAEGAFLVTINSSDENTWVHDLCGGGNCWIGGNDLSNERSHAVDGWQWHSGESNGYQNFANGEPNDHSWNNGEDCIHMWSSGQWNDHGCGIAGTNGGDGPQYSYVCEKVEQMTGPEVCVPDSNIDSVMRVRHGASHSQHRCYSDASVAQGCTCMCGNTQFDGSECKLGWTAYNDKCYKKGGSSDQWGAARTACEAEGAFLVTINADAENAWVHNLCGGGKCWIGGNDLSNERSHAVDGWQWHSGESNGYQNFKNGEPNDHSWNNGEDCIHMRSSGQWNDHGCGIAGTNGGDGPQFSYVCEMTPSAYPVPSV
jgi:hypothetical protein